MDPCSIIGTLSAAGSLIGAITKTVHNLSQLRGKYQTADITIGLLIRELSTVKASLTQIDDFIAYNLHGPLQHDLAEAFRSSLEGCKECLDLMADDISNILSDVDRGPSEFFTRARFVWNETTMKDHQQRLHTQISALQLLLQATHIHSLSGQAAFMREPKSRQVLQQVKDDASSVRAISLSRARAHSSQSISTMSMSPTQSTIGSTIFSLDRDITKTDVYLRNGAHVITKHRETQMDRAKKDISGGLVGASAANSSPPVLPRLDTICPAEIEKAINKSPVTAVTALSAGSPGVHFPNDIDELAPAAQQITSENAPRRPDSRPLLRLNTLCDSPPAKASRSPESKLSAIKQHLKNLSISKDKVSPVSPASATNPSSPLSGPGRSGRASVRRKARNASNDLALNDGVAVPLLLRHAFLGNASEVEALLEQNEDTEAKQDGSGRTALAVAALCGNHEMCTMLLRYGANVDSEDSLSQRPLHHAASRGHYDVVECLISNDADIDSVARNGMTALHYAVTADYPEVVKLLLGHGAKTRSRDEAQQTPLHTAVRLGQVDVVDLLLDHADLGAKDAQYQAPIHLAAVADFDDIFEMLVSRRVDIETPGRNSMTPLLQAAKSGAIRVVRLLLKKKASTKARAEAGFTALHYAAYHGHVEIIDLLAQRKSTVDVTSDDGRAPLHLAVASGKFAAVDFLIRKGANIEAQCNRGMRALHDACRTGDVDVAQLLVSSGAKLEVATHLGRRPLHLAAQAGSVPVMQLLLGRAAQLEVRDAAGDRALCFAAVSGHVDAVALLLAYGAAMRLKFQHRSSYEDSPLCLACKYGHLAVVSELIKRGANVSERDEHGWQPLRYATFYVWPDVVEKLLGAGATLSAFHSSSARSLGNASQRVDFVRDADIDEVRKVRTMALIHEAQALERRPREDHVSDVHGLPQPRASPIEKGNDEPHRVESLQTPVTGLSMTARPAHPSSPFVYRQSQPTTTPPDSQPTGPWARTLSRSRSIQSPVSPATEALNEVNSNRRTSTQIYHPPAIPDSSRTHNTEFERLRTLRCTDCSTAGKLVPDLSCALCSESISRFSYGQNFNIGREVALTRRDSSASNFSFERETHIFEMAA